MPTNDQLIDQFWVFSHVYRIFKKLSWHPKKLYDPTTYNDYSEKYDYGEYGEMLGDIANMDGDQQDFMNALMKLLKEGSR